MGLGLQLRQSNSKDNAEAEDSRSESNACSRAGTIQLSSTRQPGKVGATAENNNG